MFPASQINLTAAIQTETYSGKFNCRQACATETETGISEKPNQRLAFFSKLYPLGDMAKQLVTDGVGAAGNLFYGQPLSP